MADLNSPSATPSSHHHWLHLLLLLSLASLLLLTGLGTLGLTDRDEGSNAEAAREMLETGDWISPTLNYEPRYAKPAFVYWVISGTYSLFGVNEFSARLPSALFGIALLILHYYFLTRVAGPSVAWVGSLMLLLNVEVVAIFRMVLTDPKLVFFTTLSVYSFWLGFKGKGSERHYLWLFYIGMGLAMLTKGPVGILIPLLAVVPYLTLTRQWRQYWQQGFPVAGILIFIVIAAPWYLAMFAIHGAEYAAAAQANTTGRFANPMEGHSGTFLFYFPILLFGFFPWSGLLPVALYQVFQDWRVSKGTRQKSRHDAVGPTAQEVSSSQEQGANGQKVETLPLPNKTFLVHAAQSEKDLALFMGLWVVGIFIFFTLSATRLPHYILPLYPAASILTSLFWTRCLQHTSTAGLHTVLRILLFTGYLFGLILASLPVVYEAFTKEIAKEFPAATQVDVGLAPILAGVVIIIGVMLIRHFGRSDSQRTHAFGVACAMMVSVLLIILLLAIPRYSQFFIRPPQELAAIAGLNLGPNDRLIQFGRKRPSLIFYAQRKVYQINAGEDERFLSHLDTGGRLMIILQSHLRSRLPQPVSEFPVVLQRHGFSLLSSESFVK